MARIIRASVRQKSSLQREMSILLPAILNENQLRRCRQVQMKNILEMPRTRAVVGMNSAHAGELSYANNSHFQRMIACVTEKERQEMAAALYRARRPAAMAIADLGCGTGPNALLMASDAIQGVLSEYDQLLAGDDDEAVPDPEFHVFLNDLPTNDFNSVFRLLPDPTALAGHRCFLSAWPGSFYGRIFPAASLDYVVSSSSLHFLSKAPAMMPGIRNKGRIYVSEHSPPAVLHVYRTQFHADFSLFLSCRADELRHGGLLLLTFVARRTNLPSQHDCYLWDLLAVALMEMAAAGEGLVDEDKVNGFEVPYYAPCPEELTKVIHEEGSFTVRRLHLFETSRRCFSSRDDDAAGDVDDVCVSRWLAKETASTLRAVLEPMLGRHFGWDAMDDLFRRDHCRRRRCCWSFLDSARAVAWWQRRSGSCRYLVHSTSRTVGRTVSSWRRWQRRICVPSMMALISSSQLSQRPGIAMSFASTT